MNTIHNVIIDGEKLHIAEEDVASAKTSLLDAVRTGGAYVALLAQGRPVDILIGRGTSIRWERVEAPTDTGSFERPGQEHRPVDWDWDLYARCMASRHARRHVTHGALSPPRYASNRASYSASVREFLIESNCDLWAGR